MVAMVRFGIQILEAALFQLWQRWGLWLLVGEHPSKDFQTLVKVP